MRRQAAVHRRRARQDALGGDLVPDLLQLTHPESRAYYDRKRREGKRHVAALIALARRRIDVLFAMLRDGTSYQPPTPTAA